MKRTLQIVVDAEDVLCRGCRCLSPVSRSCDAFGRELSFDGPDVGPRAFIRLAECLSAEAAASRARMPEEVARTLRAALFAVAIDPVDVEYRMDASGRAALAWLEAQREGE